MDQNLKSIKPSSGQKAEKNSKGNHGFPSFWLFKTEPTNYSIEDLEKEPTQSTFWSGVRNYQARNFLRDSIKKGDHVFIYHSNTDVPAIVGTALVTREGYPDPTQYDTQSKYYDAASTFEKPRWFVVDVQFKNKFKNPITLSDLRGMLELKEMPLLQKGSRLSVQPVKPNQWEIVLKLIS